MPATRIELLQRMPIFGALRDDTLEFLLAHTQPVRLRAGEAFFREGDAATGVYVLERGTASVYKGWEGQPVLLNRLHPGDCFGEMALMDFMPRSATVQADEDCEALLLDSEDLYLLCKHDLEQFALIEMNMGREVSRRLRQVDDELFRLRQATQAQQGPDAG